MQNYKSKSLSFIIVALYFLSVLASSKNATSPFVDILGPTLYKWSIGDHSARDTILAMPTVDLLKNKDVVGIYYSAHWCGPCQQFTPILSKFYKAMQKKGKKFEIVWVSSDRSDDEYLSYYLEMPWLAVPLDSDQLAKASKYGAKHYKMTGIPHLVILDGTDATVYALDGREKVLGDEYGLQFPWRPKSVMNLIPRFARTFLSNQLSRARKRVFGLVGSILSIPSTIITQILSVPGRILRLPLTLIQLLLGR